MHGRSRGYHLGQLIPVHLSCLGFNVVPGQLGSGWALIHDGSGMRDRLAQGVRNTSEEDEVKLGPWGLLPRPLYGRVSGIKIR